MTPRRGRGALRSQSTPGNWRRKVSNSSSAPWTDLDNVGTKISGPSIFQVYQGTLPPLGAPVNVRRKPGRREYTPELGRGD